MAEKKKQSPVERARELVANAKRRATELERKLAREEVLGKEDDIGRAARALERLRVAARAAQKHLDDDGEEQLLKLCKSTVATIDEWFEEMVEFEK